MTCVELTTETPEEMITLLRGLNLEVTKDEPVYKVQKPTILRPEDVQTEEGLGETPEKYAFQQGDEVRNSMYGTGFVFNKASCRGSYIVMFTDRVAIVPTWQLKKTGRRLDFSQLDSDKIKHGGTECES